MYLLPPTNAPLQIPDSIKSHYGCNCIILNDSFVTVLDKFVFCTMRHGEDGGDSERVHVFDTTRMGKRANAQVVQMQKFEYEGRA